MLRDMDLFRNVLIEAEKLPPNTWSHVRIEGRTNEEVCYHVKLASDAGFVIAKFQPGPQNSRWSDSPMRDTSS